MSAAYRSAAAALAVACFCLFSVPATTTPAAAGSSVVAFKGDVSPGTIVVRTSERRLYLVLGQGRALAYPVGVGRAGHQWAGKSFVDSKRIRPPWAPPADMKRANPRLPDYVPSGAPDNPMGAAALTLSGGDYAIHGTNSPGSIGGFVSSGCIRMYNQDITDLYDRVSVGTPVIVTR
jgi:lipoprotein-anchoring transpeptidase ErfK/SrfK